MPPFAHVEDRLDDPPPVGGRASALLGFGEHGAEEGPLGIGQAGVINSDFHRLDWAALSMKPARSSRYVKPFIRFFSPPTPTGRPDSNAIPNIMLFQTGSEQFVEKVGKTLNRTGGGTFRSPCVENLFLRPACSA